MARGALVTTLDGRLTQRFARVPWRRRAGAQRSSGAASAPPNICARIRPFAMAMVLAFTGQAAACVSASAQPRADRYDPRQYLASAWANFGEIVRGRSFVPDVPARNAHPDFGCGGIYRLRCEEYVARIMARDFTIIAPYQFSPNNPDLPDYIRFRATCPNFAFELTHPSKIPQGRATRNFGLYRLIRPGNAASDNDVFVYRAERYVSAPETQWQGTILRQITYDGFFTPFRVEGCRTIYPYEMTFALMPRTDEQFRSFNEIIFISGQFHVIQLFAHQPANRRFSPRSPGDPISYGIILFAMSSTGGTTPESVFSFHGASPD